MGYTIKSKLWIEDDGEIVLGEGRYRLLKAMETTGSLTSAAKSIDISYQKAWKLLDTVNKNAKQPVFVAVRGGIGGGGAELTEYGSELINQFDLIRKECWEHLKRSEAKLKDL